MDRIYINIHACVLSRAVFLCVVFEEESSCLTQRRINNHIIASMSSDCECVSVMFSFVRILKMTSDNVCVCTWRGIALQCTLVSSLCIFFFLSVRHMWMDSYIGCGIRYCRDFHKTFRGLRMQNSAKHHPSCSVHTSVSEFLRHTGRGSRAHARVMSGD